MNWKEYSSLKSDGNASFAKEKQVVREAVAEVTDDDGMQRLGETKLITPLIKAVQELSAQVEELKNK